MNISDEELLRYCDGDIESELAEQIKKASLYDPELEHRILAMEASRLPYKEAFSHQQLPPVPESLVAELENFVELGVGAEAVSNRSHSGAEQKGTLGISRHTWNYVGVAASLALCFLLGYNMANRQHQAENQTLQYANSSQLDWVKRIADYQTLYVENTVSNVVQSKDEAAELLGRIESAGALKTRLPDLSSYGYSFVRAQELGYRGEQLVQLVYLKPGFAPLALCYMLSSDSQSSELRIGSHEGLRTADWVQDAQRFVIVAEESSDVMRSLYELSSEHWL